MLTEFFCLMSGVIRPVMGSRDYWANLAGNYGEANWANDELTMMG